MPFIVALPVENADRLMAHRVGVRANQVRCNGLGRRSRSGLPLYRQQSMFSPPLGHRERLKRLSRAGYRSSRVRLTRHPRSKKKTRYYPGRRHDGEKRTCKRVGDQGTQAAPESGRAKLVVLTQRWGDRGRAAQRRAASAGCSKHTSADVLVRDR